MKRLLLGFTLIELLVVIAIIGVLSAIATSSYVGYRAQSRNVGCNADAIKFGVANEQYFSLNMKYIPTVGQCNLLCTNSFLASKIQGTSCAITYVPAPAANPATYTATLWHPNGNTKYGISSGSSNITATACGGANCGGAGICPNLAGCCCPGQPPGCPACY
ncbi:MAG: type II secretion system protein [Nitrospirae bacterium]|nr:type II secretion system protein [Nitrospirota bacterium]